MAAAHSPTHSTAHSPLRPGDLVRIRDERWQIVSRRGWGDAVVIEAAGHDAANRACRARFLLPFEPVDRLPSSVTPAVVRPARWRNAVRRVLADATPHWSSLRAAARAKLTLLPFQLEPALAMTRGRGCRFLIADGVGLGKTVQAGLMMAELLHRRPDARVLVIAPAALREQWRDELKHRFDIDAEVMDAATVARLAADVPSEINPWSLRRIVVTSIDYVKRSEVMRALEALTWDFMALDEAHHLAGRSDRATAAHALASRARVVALLTATPHAGDDDRFQGLCRIGDIGGAYPLLMFMRTRATAGSYRLGRTMHLRVRPTPAEAAMHAGLIAYARRAWAEVRGDAGPGLKLAMSVLARRGCSSAGSLARSLERRLALLQQDWRDLTQLALPFADASADDEEPLACLAVPGFRDSSEERRQLSVLVDLARRASQSESKLARLRRFVARTREPAIIFTEYRDTLERVAASLEHVDTVLLHGGLTARARADALTRFTDGRARLLLATDAASEGLNLHHRCRLIVNLELPWSPLRLDQRAGRVDRIGQPRRVHAIRFVAAGTCEESMLEQLARRVDRMRNALDAIPDEGTVSNAVLGAGSISAAGRLPRTATAGIVRVNLHRQAVEEAARLQQAAAWASGTLEGSSPRPVITRLRCRRQPRRECLWAFKVTIAGTGGEPLWHTVVAASRYVSHPLPRSASDVRALLRVNPALQALVAARTRDLKELGPWHRQALALAMRRERDLMSVIRQEGGRISALVLQRALFDRRNDRAATAQTALQEAALCECRLRLDQLRASYDARIEQCDFTFAVILE